MTPANCTCSPVGVGDGEVLGYNWNPDCLEHGSTSAWYTSSEQVAHRAQSDRRLRILQLKAKAARSLGLGCPLGENLHADGECLVCDAAKGELMSARNA